VPYPRRWQWRDWPNRAHVVGATITLTALVVFVLVRIYDQADDYRRVAAQMVWFRHSAAELRAVQWQLLAEPDLRHTGFDRFRLARVGFLRARIALVEAPEPAPWDAFENVKDPPRYPLASDKVGKATTRSASNTVTCPRPSQLGQAPTGELNENRRGSSSGSE